VTAVARIDAIIDDLDHRMRRLEFKLGLSVPDTMAIVRNATRLVEATPEARRMDKAEFSRRDHRGYHAPV
jgi:hypothetical protein